MCIILCKTIVVDRNQINFSFLGLDSIHHEMYSSAGIQRDIAKLRGSPKALDYQAEYGNTLSGPRWGGKNVER